MRANAQSVFDAAPEALYKHIVPPPPLAIHTDGDLVALQNPQEGFTGKLRPLIGIEDLRRPITRYGLLLRLSQEIARFSVIRRLVTSLADSSPTGS